MGWRGMTFSLWVQQQNSLCWFTVRWIICFCPCSIQSICSGTKSHRSAAMVVLWSFTDLRTAGAAGPEQLWSWWQGSGPAAGPAGCRPHREPGPSPAPLPPSYSLSLSSAEGGKWFLSSLNVPAGLVDLPRLCAIWVRPQLLDVWAYRPGPLGCDLRWLLKVAWHHHHLATAFASSASRTASWGLDGVAPDCTPQPYLNGDHYKDGLTVWTVSNVTVRLNLRQSNLFVY